MGKLVVKILWKYFYIRYFVFRLVEEKNIHFKIKTNVILFGLSTKYLKMFKILFKLQQTMLRKKKKQKQKQYPITKSPQAQFLISFNTYLALSLKTLLRETFFKPENQIELKWPDFNSEKQNAKSILSHKLFQVNRKKNKILLISCRNKHSLVIQKKILCNVLKHQGKYLNSQCLCWSFIERDIQFKSFL